MDETREKKYNNDKVLSCRRNKATRVVAMCDNNQTVRVKSERHRIPGPFLPGHNKEVTLQGFVKNEGINKQDMVKAVSAEELTPEKDIPSLNIEKSTKDLHRCLVSVTRHRQAIKEEVENSVRNIKCTFAELYKSIIEREVQLMLEVKKVQEETLENLMVRQTAAEELKRTAELSSHKSDIDISELRAQIKRFVSERKYDEELTKSVWVTFDAEHLMKDIQLCGEISHPKNCYSTRTPSCTVVQKVTSAKPKAQRSQIRKPSVPSKCKPVCHNKDPALCTEVTDAANDASTSEQLHWSNKQAFGRTCPTNPISKTTEFPGRMKAYKSDDRRSLYSSPACRREDTRGQKGSVRTKTRRDTLNKEALAGQTKIRQHTDRGQDFTREETGQSHLKDSSGHIT
uniref:SPATS2-like protein n=1 Tax=Leptobrachium leishanense TaxID=445787 RepID=A0A8C5QKW5_9ANUR